MAYINANEVKSIREMLKETFPKFKWSVRKSSGGHSVGDTSKIWNFSLSGFFI